MSSRPDGLGVALALTRLKDLLLRSRKRRCGLVLGDARRRPQRSQEELEHRGEDATGVLPRDNSAVVTVPRDNSAVVTARLAAARA